jgi:hypothetical protein
VSVIDELRGLEDRVAQRLAELRPLVDEYHELEQYAARLGMSQNATAAAPAAARSTGRRRPRSSATRRPRSSATATSAPARSPGRPRNGGRRDQLMAVVKEQPGITVREVGTRLGVDPTSLYRIVHQLEQDGSLRKDGRELLPG